MCRSADNNKAAHCSNLHKFEISDQQAQCCQVFYVPVSEEEVLRSTKVIVAMPQRKSMKLKSYKTAKTAEPAVNFLIFSTLKLSLQSTLN